MTPMTPRNETSPSAPIWQTAANENLKRLPNHLKQFVVDQQYDKYTSIDHAVWRYVMRQNFAFLRHNAHSAYVKGLASTGIAIDKIPSVTEMNQILSKIGWACVTVDGFIPPAAFMEYQAYKVLVIAADIRQIHHIDYTPAPDIIHEAAGHAPIIADPLYAEYLRRFGEIGSKAISSRKDYELYEAIRHLSIIKELPDADPIEIEKAERDVLDRQNNLGEPSEMAKLSRMHWWTVEYGLIGDLTNPKIYGAGLLSSIGESANCLTEKVKRIPYSLAAADYAFDITTQQPQLFVTPSFQHLIDVLDAFADTMAFRTGGRKGLNKAIECRNVCTAIYSSGLQVSGVVAEALVDGNGELRYLKFQGPTALSTDNTQLAGQGKDHHRDGFGSPVGRLAGSRKPLEDYTDADLSAAKIQVGQIAALKFESGISVNGKLEKAIRHNGRIILLTFSNCTVRHGDTLLFNPAWGIYDMAVGEKIIAVFCGAADKDAYDQVSLVPKERTIKMSAEEKYQQLQGLYKKIRICRESSLQNDQLVEIWQTLQREHPGDWLAAMEILEILSLHRSDSKIISEIRDFLEKRAADNLHLRKLITDGLKLLDASPVAA